MSIFYKRFEELCKRDGKTPSIVVEEIGLNRSNATYWKRGSQPKDQTIRDLAVYFNVPMSYLLGATDSIEDMTKKHWMELTSNGVISIEDMPIVKTQQKIKKITDSHFEIVDEGEHFKKIYNEYLNDTGKYKIHRYMEDLIKNPDNLKHGIIDIEKQD